ncbi:MAG TPA: LacI family DNA-binding transcriptional regulator [Opitutaceae bacterium]|nr:LacI family DNA-binding transcriptional regulator [Opitutaceae bacterium]
MSWKPRPTLKEIARRTRLSVAAVSMALRNHPSLPPATIRRVQQAAKTLDYAPNPAARILAAHRQRSAVHPDFSLLALVSNWPQRDQWSRQESARRLLAGATDRARTYGYALQHFWAREDGMSPQRFSQVLLARGIRGLILAPFENPDSTFDLSWDEFTVVTIERATRYDRFPYVVPNYYADLRLAWDRLLGLGYRRIGMVIEVSLAERVAHQWEAAYVFAQNRSGFAALPTLVVDQQNPQGKIQAWLRKHRPDAVISRSDQVLSAAQGLRLRIPEDLGYVSLNAIDDAPQVSGILQPRDVMGATAVDMIHNLLQRNHRGFHDNSHGTQVDGTWHPGKTLRATRETTTQHRLIEKTRKTRPAPFISD